MVLRDHFLFKLLIMEKERNKICRLTQKEVGLLRTYFVLDDGIALTEQLKTLLTKLDKFLKE